MEKVYIEEKVECRIIENFLRPEFIYIPIEDNKYVSGDYIFKNDIISNNIYSPISGYVRGDTYKYINSGKKVKCMVIENDYKEKYRYNDYDINSDLFIKNLKRNGLMDEYENGDIKYLIINAIDSEPYIFSKRIYIDREASDILSIVDDIMNKLNISRTVIAVVSDSFYNNLLKYIGTYPKIKIIKVDNYYPVGNDRVLLKELYGISYNVTSLEKGIWIIDLLSLSDIECVMRSGKPTNEMVISIGGTGIRNAAVKVKIGTSIKEIINYLGGYKDGYSITIGGPLTGKQIYSDDIIITKDINAIFITKRNSDMEKECTLCGKCLSVCPFSLKPLFIMKNINNKNYLEKIGIDRCIECGLCSYICPAHINLKDCIDKAKGVVKSE